ncbi:hypothetical protein Tco_1001244 [Tanacetum coccineum]
MANLKFTDTHNMVAFLSKLSESDGFEQIMDFLNAHSIRHVLMINPTIYISCIEQFWSTVKAKTINGEVQFHALVDGKKIIITESTVRRDLQLDDAEGVDCLPNSTIFEQLALIGAKTTAWNEFSSTMAFAIICFATNQKFNFSKDIFKSMVRNLDNLSRKFLIYPRFSKSPTDPHHTPTITQSSTQPCKRHKNLGSLKERTLGGGPMCQETMGDTTAQTRFESISKHSNDSLLARGNTLRSDEDRLKLVELMTLCTTLQKRVFDLEKTKTTQQNEIGSLKRRVKKLEKKDRSRTHKLKRLYKVGLTARVESSSDEEDLGEDASKQGRRINAIDADEDITLVNVQDDADNEMFDVNVLNGEDVFVAGQNENVVEEVVDVDKGKGIMIEEPVKPMKKKVQIMLDEEAALKLQAEFDEEERLAREKAKKEKEANIALIEEWDDIQAKINADHQLAERLQAQELMQKRLHYFNNF